LAVVGPLAADDAVRRRVGGYSRHSKIFITACLFCEKRIFHTFGTQRLFVQRTQQLRVHPARSLSLKKIVKNEDNKSTMVVPVLKRKKRVPSR
jgi:hypothetical protein